MPGVAVAVAAAGKRGRGVGSAVRISESIGVPGIRVSRKSIPKIDPGW